MKLLLISSLITVSFCWNILSPADDLSCNFSNGFCKYQPSPLSNVTIAHDAESNRSYVTIDQGKEGTFNSSLIVTNETVCFKYFYYFNVSSFGLIQFYAQAVKGPEMVTLQRTVQSRGLGIGWDNDTLEIDLQGLSYIVTVDMFRSNVTDGIGVANFQVTPGKCPS
ncbi:hypothetical protein HDE_05991 [Halotydeus destructor]|nr:hypothetical protein HDE_05991 [Halotydeus destructor]